MAISIDSDSDENGSSLNRHKLLLSSELFNYLIDELSSVPQIRLLI